MPMYTYETLYLRVCVCACVRVGYDEAHVYG
jgi:hypothetical protein